MGLASAGYAARAQDAGTAATNPVGMTRLKQSELLSGVQMLYGSVEFSPDADNTALGNDGGNIIEWMPGARLFYAHSLSPDLKLGVGVFGNYGYFNLRH